MKNGRLYDGNTCDEVYPQQRKLNTDEWKFNKPATNTTVKKNNIAILSKPLPAAAGNGFLCA